MRITYLHQYFNTPNMSGGTRSYEMARRLVAMGHEVNLITSWREESSSKDWFVTEEAGIKVHWLPVPYSNKMGFFQRIKAFFQFAVLSARKAAAIDADLIFATSTPLTISIPAVYSSRKQRVPMVFEVRDLWPKIPIALGVITNPVFKMLAKWLESWAYKNSTAVVALSPAMRDGIAQVGYPRQQIAVIPNSSDNHEFGVNLDKCGERFRLARPWLGSRPLLIYPGTMGKVNGVSYLVDLARHLKEGWPDIRILLIGDGIERQVVEERARRENVLNVNLFIEAPVSKKEMPVIFAAADIICSLVIEVPVLQANSANKFFDALAAGKPLFLNYAGWQGQLLYTAECGIVSYRQSAEAGARLLAKHITDKDWLGQAGRNAKVMATELFDRDKLALQLSEVFSLVAAKRSSEVSSVAPGDYHDVKSSVAMPNGNQK